MNADIIPFVPQKGFSLLEVLVALVVLSTGLLAFSSAQISGLRYNEDAYLQSLAAWQQNSLIEGLQLCTLLTDNINCKSSVQNNWFTKNAALFPNSESKVKLQGSDYCLTINWQYLSQQHSQNQSKFHSAVMYAPA